MPRSRSTGICVQVGAATGARTVAPPPVPPLPPRATQGVRPLWGAADLPPALWSLGGGAKSSPLPMSPPPWGVPPRAGAGSRAPYGVLGSLDGSYHSLALASGQRAGPHGGRRRRGRGPVGRELCGRGPNILCAQGPNKSSSAST